uniref:Putative ovule protein n=1 Tax=Solanum chacoense TaxID=4108 RepID=A0A0V0GYE0_SOLCH
MGTRSIPGYSSREGEKPQIITFSQELNHLSPIKSSSSSHHFPSKTPTESSHNRPQIHSELPFCFQNFQTSNTLIHITRKAHSKCRIITQ